MFDNSSSIIGKEREFLEFHSIVLFTTNEEKGEHDLEATVLCIALSRRKDW